MPKPIDLRCEYRTNPLGVDAPSPRLSWGFDVGDHFVRQSAYQVVVTDAEETLWDSGKVESSQNLHVAYEGKQLRTGQRVMWKVRTWSADGAGSDWSEPAAWTAGVMPP